MKIELLVIGKTDADSWDVALRDYQRRINHYLPFEITVIPDLKHTKNMSEAQQKEREGELIIKAMQPGDQAVLLDEKGQEMGSVPFAALIERKMVTVPKRLLFIIGGPYGFSDALYQAVPERLSLSRMTFSHQMIRAIFAEQLYRAMTIIRNEPYHHA